MENSKCSMALFQTSGGDPRERFSAVLACYGALGDAAALNPRGFAARKAGAAVAFAGLAGLSATTCDALAFAGTLHAIGAIGATEMQRWDVPVFSAHLCEEIAALPSGTAELVRAQAECWDGTGFPDQLRWKAIPDAAQFLLLADLALRAQDEDDALDRVNVESGRALSPRVAQVFIRWQRAGNAVTPVALPSAALDAAFCDADALFERIAARVGEAARA